MGKKTELIKIDIEPNENLRVYENLRNNLKYFKDSYGSKIKEDDEFNIINDYEDYMTANEIYMIDIYNELEYYIILNLNIKRIFMMFMFKYISRKLPQKCLMV